MLDFPQSVLFSIVQSEYLLGEKNHTSKIENIEHISDKSSLINTDKVLQV